ncbi:Fc.00g093080.m01.CDS01 [Cosmosporella sp. VM-42]
MTNRASATSATCTSDTECPWAVFRKVITNLQRPAGKSYPSIDSIPQTSLARLAEASADGSGDDGPKARTYLYLAYGSNLSAETFLGVRGIRPLSQKNVSVPTLELKFNLPGIPYREPCFANVDYRKIPDHPKLPDPKLPDPTNPPKVPPFDPPPVKPPHTATEWDGGLVGVVYEVTEEDYHTIIRTEGGGASYKEIIVPCLPIPPKISVPEKPPIPELPRPFLARTLYAPFIPDPDLPDDPRKKKWWYRFITGPQRDPDYSQASARYLKLIADGAEEHDLPDDYQRWLNSLQPYTITSWRQQIGAFLLLATWGLFFLVLIILSGMLADENGKLPRWLAVSMAVLFNLTWMTYDAVFKPIFGDGERTQEDEESRHRLPLSLGSPTADEEKQNLLLRDW